MSEKNLQSQLEALRRRFEVPAFVVNDPIGVAHEYQERADIEIAAFFAATFAWGRRDTAVAKTRELLRAMGDTPHAFVVEHGVKDLERLDGFGHRTFTHVDLRYFLRRLQVHYRRHSSLEPLFAAGLSEEDRDLTGALGHFHEAFFELEGAPARTRKHVATPVRGSACKRLCMFLRWMVRPAAGGVDFGLWSGIRPDQLTMPVDVHVFRQAKAFGLTEAKVANWRCALELTERLRAFHPKDPCRYDFALFALGINESQGTALR